MVKQRFSNRNQRGRVLTATPQPAWATLGQTLQQLLRQQWLSQSLLVRCAVRDGTLLVLAEHLLHVEPDLEETFTRLEATIRVLLPEALLAENIATLPPELPVQLLLRISGYQQPYASSVFYYTQPSFANAPLEEDHAVPPDGLSPEAQILPEYTSKLPEAVEAKIVESNIAEPEVKPEIPESEIPELEIPELEAIEPEVGQPIVADSESILEITEPEIELTEIAKPEIAELLATDLSTIEASVEPEIAKSEAANIVEVEPVAVNGITEASSAETSVEVDLEANDDFIIQSESSLSRVAGLANDLKYDSVDVNVLEPIDIEQAASVGQSENENLENETKALSNSENKVASIEESPKEVWDAIASNTITEALEHSEATKIESIETKILQTDNCLSDSAIEYSEEQLADQQIYEQSELSEHSDEQLSGERNGTDHATAEPTELNWIKVSGIAEFNRLVNPDHSSTQGRETEQLREQIIAIDRTMIRNELVNGSSATADSEKANNTGKNRIPEPASRCFQWRAPNLGLTSAVGGFVLVSGLYALTRPCVIGACEPLQQATQLSQAAIQTAQTTDSALAIVEAYRQLNEASYLLATIPSWSRHYQPAQTLLNSYEDQAVVLGKVVKALEQANTAAKNSQNPPHPLPTWREIQWLWREVIAQLEQIPPSSTLYPLVQRKLQEYHVNLAGINQRVGIEQQAQDRINAARKAGQLAEARAGAAQTAENWQETAATWTAAITQLRQIPQSTMVYDEAQQLLEIYQPNLTQANTRQTQELSAAKAYTQALAAADQARTSEQQNQWSQATTHWQTALAQARQVPSTSSYYSQMQPLIGTYTQMLQQASQNAQRATALQTIQPNLNQACPNAAKICTYTISPQAIRVQFTSTYAQTVALTLNNQQPADSSRSSVLDQVNGSLRTLATISETTQVPIELYDAKGAKLGTYAPSLSGYVPQ